MSSLIDQEKTGSGELFQFLEVTFDQDVTIHPCGDRDVGDFGCF